MEDKATLLLQLTEEHKRLDDELKQLEKRRSLSPSEQTQVSLLKKQKLLTKDKIARLQ